MAEAGCPHSNEEKSASGVPGLGSGRSGPAEVRRGAAAAQKRLLGDKGSPAGPRDAGGPHASARRGIAPLSSARPDWLSRGGGAADGDVTG